MYSFEKKERLKRRQITHLLFNKGKHISLDCLNIRFLAYEIPEQHNQVIFVVPKRQIKSAVKRNLIRRRLRHAYRLHKHNLNTCTNPPLFLITGFVYESHNILSYHALEKTMQNSIQHIQKLHHQGTLQ